jgi:ketosteroid isomerase-like protein
MSIQAKDVVRRSYQVYASGDLAVLDEVLSPDYVDHNAAAGQGPGIDGVKAKVEFTRQTLGAIEVRFDDQIAEDDKVASRMSFVARGPDGGEVSIPLIAISQVVDGRIVAEWGIADTSGLTTAG